MKSLSIYIFVFLSILSLTNNILASPEKSERNNFQKFIVDSIKIQGNEITEDFIILRELTFAIGDEIDTLALEFNSERIYSLGLFSKVHVYNETGFNNGNIIIDVKESWYIYPIPFVFIRGGDLDRTSFGINFLYRNFRGRNETIRTILNFGYNPSFTLSYLNPVLFHDPDISLFVSAGFIRSSNRSNTAELIYGDEFDNKIYFGNINLGRRINQFNEIKLITQFRNVKIPENFTPGIGPANHRYDNNLGIGVNYIYDSRDLKQHPKSGILTSVFYSHFGFNIDDLDYNLFVVDFREYVRIFNNFTFKWRFNYRHTFGKSVPFYDYSFLGVGDFIRGHRGDDQEGNNYILSSFEFNHPIISDWDFSMKLPLLPRRLTSARIALVANLFFDAGLAYNNGQKWGLHNFQKGWGFGITILALPFNAFRIEYAFDEVKNGELILGSGFSF